MAGKKKIEKEGTSWVGEMEKYSRQIWLAGLGAYSKISNDGTKLFDTLVKDGEKAEKQAKTGLDKQVDVVKSTTKTAKSRVGDVRDLALGKWSELEEALDKRLNSAISRLGVPSRNEVKELHGKVDTLTKQIEKLTGIAVKPTAVKSTAVKPTVVKAAAKTAAAKPAAKPATKVVAKPALKPAIKPVAKAAPKSVAASAPKPAVKAPAKPAVKAAPKPAAKAPGKPAAKPAATKPASAPAAKPTTAKPAAKPAAAKKPAVKKAPAAKPVVSAAPAAAQASPATQAPAPSASPSAPTSQS